jgi:steroid 5-alpha reductase family enzyme
MISILLATGLATWIAFTLLWVASLPRQDAGIVDFYWGPGFAIIAWLAWLMEGMNELHNGFLLVALTCWGARLGWYMTKRHQGSEDARYRAMRERHGAGFARRSLWMVFWLQASIQWLASSPALVAAIMTPKPEEWVVWIGALVFAAGFALEIMADREVARFRIDPANKGKLLTTGLHARIRHPNYLGEIILQWGMGLIAFGGTLNLLAFVGPALMTGLIVKVSGVPLLEEQFKTRPGYAEWAARAGALWPRLLA